MRTRSMGLVHPDASVARFSWPPRTPSRPPGRRLFPNFDETSVRIHGKILSAGLSVDATKPAYGERVATIASFCNGDGRGCEEHPQAFRSGVTARMDERTDACGKRMPS